MNTTRIEINTGILELYQEKYKINPEYISEAIQDMVLEKVKDEVMEYNNQNKDNQISITHTMIYKLKTLRNKKIERQKIAAILNRIDADETDYIPQYTNHIKQEIKEFQEIQEPGEIIKIASTSENDDSEYLHIITNRNAYTINTEIGLQKRTPIKNIIRDEETINLYTRYESKEENEENEIYRNKRRVPLHHKQTNNNNERRREKNNRSNLHTRNNNRKRTKRRNVHSKNSTKRRRTK